jgi:DNA-directed RNA polymerase subunit M/transcription elongation factor TFIIS
MSMLFCPRCHNLCPLHNIESVLVFSCATCPFQYRVEKKMESRKTGEKKKIGEIEGQKEEGQLDNTGTLFHTFRFTLSPRPRPLPLCLSQLCKIIIFY